MSEVHVGVIGKGMPLVVWVTVMWWRRWLLLVLRKGQWFIPAPGWWETCNTGGGDVAI
jgi:hypothetical protein